MEPGRIGVRYCRLCNVSIVGSAPSRFRRHFEGATHQQAPRSPALLHAIAARVAFLTGWVETCSKFFASLDADVGLTA